MDIKDKYKKIIMDTFDMVIITEYLYICDDELFNRNRYVEIVTSEQERMAEEFRKSFADSIKEFKDRGDIKLEGDFYTALNKEGEIFIAKINEALVVLTEKQAAIKSDIIVNLDLEVELDSKNKDEIAKIFEIVLKYGTLSANDLRDKYIDKLSKKILSLTDDEKIECIKIAKEFIESL